MYQRVIYMFWSTSWNHKLSDALRKICQNTGFLWRVYSSLMTESKILSLHRVRGNPYSRIFYTVIEDSKIKQHQTQNSLCFCGKEIFSILINFKVSHLPKVGRNQAHIYRTAYSLSEKCWYSEFFWSFFSCIRTEYWEILRISQYLILMGEKETRETSKTDTFFAVIFWTISYNL